MSFDDRASPDSDVGQRDVRRRVHCGARMYIARERPPIEVGCEPEVIMDLIESQPRFRADRDTIPNGQH